MRPRLGPDVLQLPGCLFLRSAYHIEKTQGESRGPGNALPAVDGVTGGNMLRSFIEPDRSTDIPTSRNPFRKVQRSQMALLLNIIERQSEYSVKMSMKDLRDPGIHTISTKPTPGISYGDKMGLANAAVFQMINELRLTVNLNG